MRTPRDVGGTEDGEDVMVWIGAIVATGLVVYLVVALLAPERLS
ncbi:MAG: K(+)-transporting ATPase subunit F [Polyangiaceae bacterium]